MVGNLIANFFAGRPVHARGGGGAADRGADRHPAGRSSGVRSRSRIPMARDLDIVSSRGRLVARCSAPGRSLIYVFLFAPIVLLVVFSFNANKYGTFPITGWTGKWYGQVFHDYQIHDALDDDDAGSRSRSLLVSTVVGTAAAFPLVRSRLRFRSGIRIAMVAPDHDPRPPDRSQPARPLHERVPPTALADDGRRRAERVHDPVRPAARGRPAPGLRREPRARRERPGCQHVQPAPVRRPAAARAGDPCGSALRVHALARRVHHHPRS